ncbi:MAG: hypothetical protein GC134_00160 [Proteobacteria bacterium]|nr:hypothetical protein [Pseudomonadota bacterium]
MLRRLSVFAFAAVLAGCATTSTSPFGGSGGNQPKHMIKIVTANSDLRAQVEQAMATSGTLSPVSEDEFSAYNLVINDGLPAERAESLGSKPRIVGVLKAEKRPAYYRMGYTLLDMQGKPVTSGDVVGVGDNQQAMFPALRDAGSASPAALGDAVSQLVTELGKRLASQAWRSTVLSQEGTQVVIAGSRAQGLKEGMTFEVENLPGSSLKVVGFKDNDETVLDVVAGATPSVGYIVTRTR